jgi:glutaredoxin 3
VGSSRLDLNATDTALIVNQPAGELLRGCLRRTDHQHDQRLVNTGPRPFHGAGQLSSGLLKECIGRDTQARVQSARHLHEVFSAGCAVCQETVEMVRRIAGTSHTVEVLDTQRADVVAKAKQYGVQRVPSVVIDGQLASCCADRAPDEATLRTAIHG